MWLVTGVVSWVDSFLLFLVKLGGSARALQSRAPPTTRPQVAPLALPVLRPRPRSPLFFPSVSVFNSRFSVCVFVPPSSSPLWASRSNFARGLVGSLRASWLRPACPRRPLSEARPSPFLCGHLSRPSSRHVAVIRCWPVFLRLLPSARGSHFRVVVVMGAAVLGESEWQAPLVLAVTWGCHSLPPQRVATRALAAESPALGEATARTCVTLASGSSASAAHPRPEHVDCVARSASRQQPPCCHSGGFRWGASCRPAPQPRGAGVRGDPSSPPLCAWPLFRAPLGWRRPGSRGPTSLCPAAIPGTLASGQTFLGVWEAEVSFSAPRSLRGSRL